MKSDISTPLDEESLKVLIIDSLKKQGFILQDNQCHLPNDLDKEKVRALHREAVRHKIEERKRILAKHEASLLQRFAFGKDVVPDKIYPELIEVHSRSEDEILFRYASLHWSIPVSSGYGRRLRFLVVDRHTKKLIGLFGLGDPVFSLKNRDQWIGWNKDDRIERLRHVVDAYVLGAVPPYSFLLGGKLIALLTTSNEVREAFKRKYEGNISVIRKREQPGEIALITTTSALGRSSLYNRLKFNEDDSKLNEGRLVFKRVGYTQGFGEFHFSNGIYDSIIEYAKSNTTATASHESWGKGFRNKQEVVRKTLAQLGLPRNWLNHGIKREIYVAPLAKNTCAFLRGDVAELDYYDQPVSELFSSFREGLLIPRSKEDERYKEWEPKEWELWRDSQQNKPIISERKPERISTEILEVLRNNPKVTLRELQEQFQISHREAAKHRKTALETLSNEKKVEKEHQQIIAKGIGTEILEVLRNNPKVTLRELQEQFQISYRNAAKHRKTALETLSNEKLIVKAIDRRQTLENAFRDHELSEYLTYEEFIDVCISKKKAFTTAWRSCAISNQAIKDCSNYLKAVRSVVADCEMLIKGINHGDGGAAWMRILLQELKSATADTSSLEADKKEGRK